MKICVFSDVHGNAEALRSAIDVMRLMTPDVYVYLGDLCGYYPFVRECFDQLMTLTPLVALRGNHDDYFLKIHSGDLALRDNYGKKYGDLYSALIADVESGEDVFRWLDTLNSSHYLESASCIFYHGSPLDSLEGRLYPTDEIEFVHEATQQQRVRFVFMGHTHYALDSYFCETRYINPGSVGQPRQGCPPSFYYLNTESGEGRHIYFRYDRDRFAELLSGDERITRFSREAIWRY